MVDGDKIKRAREKLGLTQEEAAKLAGLSGKSAWYHLETGRRQPSMATLDKIAKALKTKPKDLLK
ncbi:MAG TPA: helix-turn-helix transcriptional regulator [Tepidisphaeraceae bacterium]|jgi:transcriptional regulator with XRE-family HTH domain